MKSKSPGIFIFSACFFLLFACQNIKEAEFRHFEKIDVESLNTQEITITANTVYFNPNTIGGTLESCQFKVFANDVFVSDVSQDISSEIGANQEFKLPVKAQIPLNKIVNKDSGLFGQIVNVLLQKKVILKIEGEAELRFKGIPFTVPFNRLDTIKI